MPETEKSFGAVFKGIKKRVLKDEDGDPYVVHVVTFEFVTETWDEASELKKKVESREWVAE